MESINTPTAKRYVNLIEDVAAVQREVRVSGCSLASGLKIILSNIGLPLMNQTEKFTDSDDLKLRFELVERIYREFVRSCRDAGHLFCFNNNTRVDVAHSDIGECIILLRNILKELLPLSGTRADAALGSAICNAFFIEGYSGALCLDRDALHENSARVYSDLILDWINDNSPEHVYSDSFHSFFLRRVKPILADVIIDDYDCTVDEVLCICDELYDVLLNMFVAYQQLEGHHDRNFTMEVEYFVKTAIILNRSAVEIADGLNFAMRTNDSILANACLQ